MQLEDIQTLKIIVVGETNVGKSSLIRKIISGKFDDKTVSLIENIETRFLH
jgi:GTPase SAR1 family protein